MSNTTVNWVAEKLSNDKLDVVSLTTEGFLHIKSEAGCEFSVAVLAVHGVIQLSDVIPIFSHTTKPQFVLNVPSKTPWSGGAIDRIHAEHAAFGRLGEVFLAANTENPGSYRNKNIGFFTNAIAQHTNVLKVSYVFDTVVYIDRKLGAPVTVAIVEAYNMSAEDVRNAKSLFGNFDVIVKSTSYGSITSPAIEAAKSMGAKALTFAQLMGRLNN